MGIRRVNEIHVIKHTYERCEEQPSQRMLPGLLPQVIDRLGYARRCDNDYQCNRHAVEQGNGKNQELPR